MADKKQNKVQQSTITSTAVTSFNGGLDQRSETKADSNTFTVGRNVRVTSRGELTHRYGLKYWLPNTADTVYQVFPALYNNELYYFVADEGKIKYCQDGDVGWTDVGGDNEVTTGEEVITTFLRVLDKIVVLNGEDMLRYVDLATMSMIQTVTIPDPTAAPTLNVTGSSISLSGNSKIYYGITFNTVHGETKLSPIVTSSMSKSRNSWKTDGTEFINVNRNNTAPTNAVSWNLYMADAAAGSTITHEDMLPLAVGLDIGSTTFTDTGVVPLDLSRGTAPADNSTGGPTCRYGIESDGRPILYGDKNNPYTLYIGGDGDHALDFSLTHGGYTKSMNKGTNYYPTGVVGFRNGQGLPSLTVLFSNTEGLSKQSILEQKTVTYGNISFVVWASTDQNYGAAGVASPYSVVNYNGGLHFMSVDGHMVMDTEASLQNVLSIRRVSDRVNGVIGSIRNESIHKVVGTAWANQIYMSVPSNGYNFNNEIVVYDVQNKENPIYYVYDIKAQWIGTISPSNNPAFIYVCQGNSIFKLVESYAATDDNADGTTSAFPVAARGTLMGLNEAHDHYKAIVQAVFYFTNFIGSVEVGVRYRNERGKMKTKTKTESTGEYSATSSGGWSSPGYLWGAGSRVLRWGEVARLEDMNSVQKRTMRVKLRMGNVIASEMQWFYNINLDNSTGTLRSVSYEGKNLGNKVDLI